MVHLNNKALKLRLYSPLWQLVLEPEWAFQVKQVSLIRNETSSLLSLLLTSSLGGHTLYAYITQYNYDYRIYIKDGNYLTLGTYQRFYPTREKSSSHLKFLESHTLTIKISEEQLIFLLILGVLDTNCKI